MTSITLTKLKSNSNYRVELRAMNSLGYSEPAHIIFRTPESNVNDEDYFLEQDLNEANLNPFSMGLITGIYSNIIFS